MIIDRQVCKAARALAEWTAVELAEKSGVPHDTIRSFESGRTKNLNARNQEAIGKALESQGIQFLESGDIASGAGVVLQADK